MLKFSDMLIITLYVIACYIIMQQIFAMGYVSGFYGRDTSYVKKGLVKKGNILEYPFRNTGGQTSETSDCNSFQQSGQEPEKEGA